LNNQWNHISRGGKRTESLAENYRGEFLEGKLQQLDDELEKKIVLVEYYSFELGCIRAEAKVRTQWEAHEGRTSGAAATPVEG